MLRLHGCLLPKFRFGEVVIEVKLPLNNHPGNGQRYIINGEFSISAGNSPFF